MIKSGTLTRKISEGRKTAYYIGMALVIIGAISFDSVFFSATLNFGNFDNFESRGKSMAARVILPGMRQTALKIPKKLVCRMGNLSPMV